MRKSDLDLTAGIPTKMVKRKWDSSSGFYPSLRNLVQEDSGDWREDTATCHIRCVAAFAGRGSGYTFIPH